jgi:hypothetical protein
MIGRGTSNMTVDRGQIIDELKSTEDPKLVQEGDFQSDNILRLYQVKVAIVLKSMRFPLMGRMRFHQMNSAR